MVHGERGGGGGTEEWKKDGPGVISDEAQAKLKELETPSVTYVGFAPWFASLVRSNVGGERQSPRFGRGTSPIRPISSASSRSLLSSATKSKNVTNSLAIGSGRENMARTDVKKRGIEVGEGGNNDVIQQASKKFRLIAR